jgi:hypothetical protein
VVLPYSLDSHDTVRKHILQFQRLACQPDGIKRGTDVILSAA